MCCVMRVASKNKANVSCIFSMFVFTLSCENGPVINKGSKQPLPVCYLSIQWKKCCKISWSQNVCRCESMRYIPCYTVSFHLRLCGARHVLGQCIRMCACDAYQPRNTSYFVLAFSYLFPLFSVSFARFSPLFQLFPSFLPFSFRFSALLSYPSLSLSFSYPLFLFPFYHILPLSCVRGFSSIRMFLNKIVERCE